MHPATDSVLLDALKQAFGLRSDAQVANLLGLARTTIHAVRHDRMSLGIKPKLAILDLVGFQNRSWVRSLETEWLLERLRERDGEPTDRALAPPGASPEARLLDLVRHACRSRTDEELAAYLAIRRSVVSNARAGRTSLGPRPRLRILALVEPFDPREIDNLLHSATALAQLISRRPLAP